MTTESQQGELLVALDIGTTKIAAICGRKDANGRLEILGTGRVESTGVTRGVVSNIDKTVSAIKEAIANCERASGVDIKVVNVGIAGQHIRSLQHRGILMRDNTHNEIGQQDLDKLITDMYKLVLPPGDKILHVLPQEYIIDYEQGIKDPIGMAGVRLEANFHIVTGQITATKNIYKCVEKAGMEVDGLTLEPIASALAVLSNEEREAGVCLVDIGGGTTDIAIFHDGIIRHTAVVPFGGNVITKDIKDGCNVMPQQAEKLKTTFGSAFVDELEDNRLITIPGLKGRDFKEISERNLALIIQARMEEILAAVHFEIRRSGYERKLIGGIVLTGGGSQLRHLSELFEFHTGIACRVGNPAEQLAHGYSQEICSPSFATGVGLLLNAIETNERAQANKAHEIERKNQPSAEKPAFRFGSFGTSKPTEQTQEQATGFLGRLFEGTKRWFEADPDVDM